MQVHLLFDQKKMQDKLKFMNITLPTIIMKIVQLIKKNAEQNVRKSKKQPIAALLSRYNNFVYFFSQQANAFVLLFHEPHLIFPVPYK